MKKKPIVITMGEPSGVASEILLKTWLLRRKKKLPPFFAIDSLKKLNHINNLFDLKVKFKLIEKPLDSNLIFSRISFLKTFRHVAISVTFFL